jgi:hypothetical protein
MLAALVEGIRGSESVVPFAGADAPKYPVPPVDPHA